MTAIATHVPNFHLKLNWPRIGALSGSMSLHLYLLVLLFAPPIAMQLLKQVQPEPPTFFRVISEPPPTVVKPEPAPPTPVHHESHPRVIPHVAPIEQANPVIAPKNEVSFPTNTQAAETVTSTQNVAPTALAYNTRTRVAYPREALLRREQGTVVLRVLVGADGIPQTVEIETSSGSPRLDSAAREAVKHWSFRAGTRNGVATGVWARVPVAFNLSTL